MCTRANGAAVVRDKKREPHLSWGNIILIVLGEMRDDSRTLGRQLWHCTKCRRCMRKLCIVTARIRVHRHV